MTKGLAWTESGGDIIHIEATLMKGKGVLTLTGHLGDVMKESAHAALSYIRSRDRRLKINLNDQAGFRIAVLFGHFPVGHPAYQIVRSGRHFLQGELAARIRAGKIRMSVHQQASRWRRPWPPLLRIPPSVTTSQ